MVGAIFVVIRDHLQGESPTPGVGHHLLGVIPGLAWPWEPTQGQPYVGGGVKPP